MNPLPPQSGTSQDERIPVALDPATAPLDARDDLQLAAAARRFASGLTFWNTDGKIDPGVDWAQFFPDPGAATTTRAQAALFHAFLRLHRHALGDLNALTGRHLDFHLRKVLRLLPQPARADLAHLVLQLKKSATEARVSHGAIFTSGDGSRYQATEEIFIRPAKIVHLRTIHRDADGILRHAPISNSGDGLGGDLPRDDGSWQPFGTGRQLPAAPGGFALSSPVLLLREGKRTITVAVTLTYPGVPPRDAAVKQFFENSVVIELSGEKSWLKAGAISVSGTARNLEISCELTGDDEPVVPCDPTVLEGGFDTVAPVMKITAAGDAPPAVRAALAAATVASVAIRVVVEGMKDLLLENDHGRLDPSKPFLPFGPQPRAGSSFYIGAEEALAKRVTSAVLDIEWAGVPANLANHYAAYRNGAAAIVANNSHFTAKFQLLRSGRFENLSPVSEMLFDPTDATKGVRIDSADATLALTMIPFQLFTTRFSRGVGSANLKLPFSNVAISRPVATLVAPRVLDFRTRILLPAVTRVSRLSAATREGFLRLILDKSFLEEKFAPLFSAAVAHNAAHDDQVAVPSRPYLPEISSFALDYAAATGAIDPNARTKESFEGREIRIYHLHPFGQREEHGYIKSSVGASDAMVTLFPRFADEGELLIGLSGLTGRQDISLLFQVRDGSANPDVIPRPVRWSVLASNHWRELADEEILAETTGGLLVSGHVRISLPAETTTHNTLLEPGLVWLRASVDSQADAVCRLLAVMPNAVPVVRADATGAGNVMPDGSIKNAVPSIRGVQQVTQPFASFGGAAAEDDRAFRTRAAERLRHRGRAVTPWDYERLVLQQFPKIHRAKCLPHTTRDFSKSPGSVTVVVLPDTRGSAAASSLTPKTDLATLAEIDRFLAKLDSPFVTAAAANPAFEPVELRFEVAFRNGLPFASYREILRAEIDRWLAPWAHGTASGPGFGGVLHRSALVARIDGLPYVDFLTKLEFLHQPRGSSTAKSVQSASPSSPASILTSSGNHQIDPVT
jgi:hypothetical protein